MSDRSVTTPGKFRIINMKTIYMESTINLMSRTEVEALLAQDVEIRELPATNERYLVLVTKPD